MQELRFVAVSEDGSYAVLAVPGRSARFTLPIDERLRAVALGQTSRLAQYEIEVESPLRPKEIQARIRAGETVEAIADAAGIPVERVRWFEGPVLAERAYIAEQAQSASVRRAGDSAPGPRLGDVVTARLKAVGIDPDDAQWDSRKRGDGSWQVQLTVTSGGRLHTAEWVFDQRRRHVSPEDENAGRLSLPEEEFGQSGGSSPFAPAASGEATVTPLAPRLGAAQAAAAGGSTAVNTPLPRIRHDRPAPQPSRTVVDEPRPPAPEPEFAPPAEPFAGPGFMPPADPVPPAASTAPAAPAEPAALAEPAARTTPAPAASSTPVAPAEPAASSTLVTSADPAPSSTLVTPAEPAASSTPVAPADPAASTPTAPAEPATIAAPVSPAAPAARATPAPAATAPPAASNSAATSPAPAPPAADTTPKTSIPAKPSTEPAQNPPARQGRKAARGRRSSVPSWDEIMLGSSRQQD